MISELAWIIWVENCIAKSEEKGAIMGDSNSQPPVPKECMVIAEFGAQLSN